MLHLAIECSALAGSVAVLQQQTVLTERALPPAVGSVQTLAPTIAELLDHYRSSDLPAVGLISVTHGPGSFTGLRSGLALAKMLGLAWQIPIVAGDTLHVIAAQAAHGLTSQGPIAKDAPGTVVAVLNAFRKQVFAGAWRMPTDSSHPLALDLIPVAQPQVLAAELWQAQPLAALTFTDGERQPDCDAVSRASPAHASHARASPAHTSSAHASLPLWISGAGLRNYMPQLVDGASLTDPTRWDPTAAWVGRLGWHSYVAGEAVSAAELAPNYVRSSAAEEVRDARG